MKFSSIAAFGLLSLAGEALAQLPLAQRTVKVMPFGASIVTRCWRNNLQAKLMASGVTNYNMVGSQKGIGDCLRQFPGTDDDNEGHPGSQATDYVARGSLVKWLNQQPEVDVVIMFLGHNDVIIGNKPLNQVFAAYGTLIDQIRAKNRRMQIVWSNLTPVDPARMRNSDRIRELSAGIRAYAAKKSTPESPIHFVDNFDGYNPKTDTEDGLHPNHIGNEKLASNFLGPTRDAIRAVTKPKAPNHLEITDAGTDFVDIVQGFLQIPRRGL